MSGRRCGQVLSVVAALVVVAGGAAHAFDPVGASAYGLAFESAAAASPCTESDPFPRFPAIQGNVEFWKRVFAEWSLGQIAVHDLKYPAIVYEVIDLPGPTEERYTKEQIKFAEKRVELWEDRLRALEHAIAHGDPLDDEEKEWALLITTNGGTDTIERAHQRVRSQRGLRERFRRGLEISFRYDGVIREIFREAGLPQDLAYLPHVESSFQASARSSAGAVGVWQFTRGTGRKYLEINSAIDERLDPIAAARGAAEYLKDAHAILGSWPLALTAYNHGIGGMRRAATRFDSDYERIFMEYEGRLFGFASKNFYAEFLAAGEIAAEPERYFPEGLNPESPFDREEIVLEGRTTPGRLAKAYGLPVDELAAVNPAWSRRAVRSGLALPEGTSIWFPPGTAARLDQEGHEPDYTLAGWIDEGGSYVVQPGDSLSVIAEAYGISLVLLRELNDIPAGTSLIHVGQILRLVGGGDRPGFHIVVPGETLLRIALKYGVKLADLLHLNRLTERSVIYPGQKLHLPHS